MRFLAALFLLSWLNHSLLADGVDYLRDIKPILKERCYACHGALQQKGKLRLDSRELMLKGGRNGEAISPSHAKESLLVERITDLSQDTRMPPEGKPLTEKQITLLKQWIDSGAKVPDGDTPEEDPKQHWSFLPPKQSPLPQVNDPDWQRNPIDAFLYAEMQKRNLKPNPPTDNATLLRRVYLDLIGLPPTREQLAAFLNDSSTNAYEKVVDQLLSSPQYGERWARHWMDVWRYSDWYGRRSVPDVMNSYARIFHWRDWIVRSLNHDKGYDRMITEMLAADEICPEEDENVVATGFLVRNWFKWNYHQWMKDSVEHTAKAFLGLTLNCAHCHDHKYDPIRQEEYFKFRAFFEPLELRHDRVPGEPDPGPFQKYVYGVAYGPIPGGKIRVFDEKLDAKTLMYSGGEERNTIEGKPPIPPLGMAFLKGDQLSIQPVELPLYAWYPGLKPSLKQEEIAKREANLKSAKTALQQALQQHDIAFHRLADWVNEQGGLQFPMASAFQDALTKHQQALEDAKLSLQIAVAQEQVARTDLESYQARIAAAEAKYLHPSPNADDLAKMASKSERRLAVDNALLAIANTGKLLALAHRTKNSPEIQKRDKELMNQEQQLLVARKNLTVESTTYTSVGPIYPQKSTGRRTALAHWIASKENPLTARVAMNHIWGWHFGKPLVETTHDLGRNGKRSSHPELLDYLAVELMKSDWKMKSIHKLIVTSRAYQISSRISKEAAQIDPDNRLGWRFSTQRMQAEVVRDSILHLSGQLDRTFGGVEIPHEQGLTSKRRSLYFAHHGESKMEFLDIFDGANPCDCYKRTSSVLPQQALAMSNSDLVLREGRILANKLWQSLGTQPKEETFLQSTFEQILSRSPSAAEIQSSLNFLKRQRDLFEKSNLPKTVAPQGQPSNDPSTRARENFVIALFNHNDFVTVR